jgi:flagellar biosynthetic protein FliR
VALPGVTALLVANLAFGVVSRAAPSMNLFAVGLPISLVFGLVVIIAGLPALESGFTRLLAETMILLQHLSGA